MASCIAAPLLIVVIESDSEAAITMPTRNVNLTEELDLFVKGRVESGQYENASEVVRAALRGLERDEQRFEAELAVLQRVIDQGDASGIADGDVFGRVRNMLHLHGARQ